MGPMTRTRWKHSAVLLPDGRVLLAGGWGPVPEEPAMEVFDPQTETFTALEGRIGRDRPEAALLLDSGKVLLIGNRLHLLDLGRASILELGTGVVGSFVASGVKLAGDGAYLFGGFLQSVYWSEPTYEVPFFSGQFTEQNESFALRPTNHLRVASFDSTLTTLLNGSVLIAGGSIDPYGFDAFSDFDIYDPATGAYRWLDTGFQRRFAHEATLLPDGKVLFTGGYDFGPLSVAELFDPNTNQLSALPLLKEPRAYHTATLLRNGEILIAGGDMKRPSAEILHTDTSHAELRVAAARNGDYLEIYATGIAAASKLNPQVIVNGQLAQIVYDGPAPGHSELRQINVRIPDDAIRERQTDVQVLYLNRVSNRVVIPTSSLEN